ADLVKLEGAGSSIARAAAIVASGIPVVGHLGLTPQSATMLGGFKAQARTAREALRLCDDALALERAGCCAIVLEAVPAAGGGRRSGDRTSDHSNHRDWSRRLLRWPDSRLA